MVKIYIISKSTLSQKLPNFIQNKPWKKILKKLINILEAKETLEIEGTEISPITKKNGKKYYDDKHNDVLFKYCKTLLKKANNISFDEAEELFDIFAFSTVFKREKNPNYLK